MADEQSRQASPPEAPPPIITRPPAGDGREWPTLLAYLAVALVIAAVIVLGGRFVYNQITDDSPPEQAQEEGTDRTAQPPAAAPESDEADQDPNQDSNRDQEPEDSTAPPPSPSVDGERDEIADTGPGQVLAIFVTTTLAVAGLHYIVSLRRAS